MSGYALGYSGIDGERPILVTHACHHIDHKVADESDIRRCVGVIQAGSGGADAATLEAGPIGRHAGIAFIVPMIGPLSAMWFMARVNAMFGMNVVRRCRLMMSVTGLSRSERECVASNAAAHNSNRG